MSEKFQEFAHLRVPAWCPVCGYPMKGAQSTDSFYMFGACVMCKIYFIEGREDRWRSGWRPSNEEIDRMFSQL